MNGTYTATVDRIVDGETAVVLIEEDGEVVEQFDVPVERVPEPADEDGGVLTVTITDDEVVEMTYEAERTRKRRESNRDRLDRLSKRLRDREDP